MRAGVGGQTASAARPLPQHRVGVEQEHGQAALALRHRAVAGDPALHQVGHQSRENTLNKEDGCFPRNATGYQQSCPYLDRWGFVFTDELSGDWQDLDQVEVLVFHSWVAERARVANVTGNRVYFQQPLKVSQTKTSQQ